ncbi:MAG TPA: hypothetical protein VGZ91_19420 [Candidatus Sulfotelmatobacter sp.]|jgi:hypothetical protein|nr:hypothetical protein [Candidatus Sulfotelmatobacter sp.]
MKNLIVVLLLSAFALASGTPCVILKRASTGEHSWSGIEYQYVRGQYPPGFKFRTNLRGRHMRELQKMGAHFVILETTYTLPQLEEAEKQCAQEPTQEPSK